MAFVEAPALPYLAAIRRITREAFNYLNSWVFSLSITSFCLSMIVYWGSTSDSRCPLTTLLNEIYQSSHEVVFKRLCASFSLLGLYSLLTALLTFLTTFNFIAVLSRSALLKTLKAKHKIVTYRNCVLSKKYSIRINFSSFLGGTNEVTSAWLG